MSRAAFTLDVFASNFIESLGAARGRMLTVRAE
jgi:hypothetical protein